MNGIALFRLQAVATRDPQLRSMPDGSPVTTLALEIPGRLPGDSITYDVDIYGEMAQQAVSQISRGDFVFVKGYPKKKAWTSRRSNITHTKVV
jgi:single-stranded DNA-binding protein